MKVQLGLGVPSAEIIEDRVFNSRAELEASGGLPVSSGLYNPRADPTRVLLNYKESPDGLFVKREQYVLNRKSATGADSADGQPIFIRSESFRTVDVGPKTVQVAEFEVITEVKLLADGNAAGRQRVLVYHAPDPVPDSFAMMRTDSSLRIWSSLTSGKENSLEGVTGLKRKALAAYDYSIQLQRTTSDDGAVCVDTPKSYTQCQPPGFWGR